MNQTSIIAGALIVAFIVFVTVRGELPCYLKVLGISTGAACQVGGQSTLGSAIGSIAGGVMGGNSTVGGVAQGLACQLAGIC